jgi:Anti-sigma-K factor rskA, C-terminal
VSEPIDPREQFGEHGEWDALAVGWALSALDPEDEDRFAEHLPGCARCTATVRESLYTVADLAYALPDEAPPPSLKSRLMAAAAAEPRTRGALAPQPPAEPEPEEEWPLGEPHPGSPGYGIDWFAGPGRPAEAAPDDTTPVPDDRTTEPAPGDEATAGRELKRAAGDAPLTGPERPAETDRPAAPEHADKDVRADADVRAGADVRAAGEVPAGDGDRAGDAVVGEPDLAPSGYRGSEVEDQEETAEVVPLTARRRRLARRIGIGVAAAAVLALIVGLLVSNARLRDQKDDLRQVVAQREAAIQQLTANGPAKIAALTKDGQPSPDRRATLVVRGDHVEIIVESLGPTTGDETYWLWTLRCDTPQPTDLKPIRGFTVTQSEFSVRDIGSDPGVASAPCFAISSEQGAATPKAPRQVVAVGQPR